MRNMEEEAHDSGSAEGQYPAAPLPHTRWTGAAGEKHGDEDGANPGGGNVSLGGIWNLGLGFSDMRF